MNLRQTTSPTTQLGDEDRINLSGLMYRNIFFLENEINIENILLIFVSKDLKILEINADQKKGPGKIY